MLDIWLQNSKETEAWRVGVRVGRGSKKGVHILPTEENAEQIFRLFI